MMSRAATEWNMEAAQGAPAEDFGDPLRYGVHLPLQTIVYPLGFPVRVATNSADVVAATNAAWGDFEQRFGRNAIEVRLAVSGSASSRPNPPPLPFGQEHLISVVHGAGNFAVADVDRGFIFGWLTADTPADHGYLQYHFLEPLVYLTLGCLYLVPVHAACMALGGSGVLLCGDSGAGKTSLAYALAKCGWTYLSDDASYLVRGTGRPRVLGKPHQIRFRSAAKSLFPELAGFREVVRPNGKPDLELSTAILGLSELAQEAEPRVLVFLRREAGAAARLRAADSTAALARLDPVLCFGPAEVRREQRRTLEELIRLPAFDLVYWDLAEVDPLLRQLV